MKNLILIVFALMFVSVGHAQKQKVQFKKEVVYVDKVEWCKFERVGTSKHILYTLDGTEYLSAQKQRFGSGRYDTNGKEIEVVYYEIYFLGTEIPIFETKSNLKKLVRLLIKNGVITEEGAFDEEQAKNFREKYQENISEQRFLTK